MSLTFTIVQLGGHGWMLLFLQNMHFIVRLDKHLGLILLSNRGLGWRHYFLIVLRLKMLITARSGEKDLLLRWHSSAEQHRSIIPKGSFVLLTGIVLSWDVRSAIRSKLSLSHVPGHTVLVSALLRLDVYYLLRLFAAKEYLAVTSLGLVELIESLGKLADSNRIRKRVIVHLFH